MLALDGSGMLGEPIWTEREGWMDGYTGLGDENERGG